MEIILFTIGFSVYAMLAYLSYSEHIKASNIYFALGLLLSIVANFIWLTICRLEGNASRLLVKGLLWDIMLTTAYLIVPLMFYQARLTFQQSIGVLMILVGIVLVHK